ncbi:MAG: hypothetical protein ACLSVD_13245 [Eggerthellaceae bacterium]
MATSERLSSGGPRRVHRHAAKTVETRQLERGGASRWSSSSCSAWPARRRALSDNAEDEAIACLRRPTTFGESPAELGSHAGRQYAHARRTLFYLGLGQLTLGSLQEDEAVLRRAFDSWSLAAFA